MLQLSFQIVLAIMINWDSICILGFSPIFALNIYYIFSILNILFTIVYISVLLCVNLTVPWGLRYLVLPIILGVSVRVFVDEISIPIGRLSREDCPPRCVKNSSNQLKI